MYTAVLPEADGWDGVIMGVFVKGHVVNAPLQPHIVVVQTTGNTAGPTLFEALLDVAPFPEVVHNTRNNGKKDEEKDAESDGN